MKRLLIALAMLPLFSYAQTDSLPRNEDGKIEYTAVVPIPLSDASTIYSRAKLFIANAFVSSQDVTQLNDDAAKTIVAKGNFKLIMKEPMIGTYEFGHVKFTMNIQAKDNKYRYFITDLVHVDNGKNRGSGGSLENEKPACGTFLLPKKTLGTS